MKGQNLSPRCHLPWQSMVIDSYGQVMPCGYWKAFRNNNPYCGNLEDNSLLEIWNGEVYRRLRKNMAAGDLEAAGCVKCFALEQGIPMGLMYDEDADCEQPPRTGYAKNIHLLKEEISMEAMSLKAQPTVISLTPSYQCNLRCIHCYQTPDRESRLTREGIMDEFYELLPTLVRIVAGGGEPFFMPLWRRFIFGADISVNPYLEFATTTNATLVTDKILEGLRRFKRLAITVSFDAGTKEVYEKIRVNANFEQVAENIDKLIALIREKPGSHLGLDFSVMKANIKDLPQFIRFAHQKGLCFTLLPVMAYPTHQCLTYFNNPMEQMGGWQEALEESYRIYDELYGAWLAPKDEGEPNYFRNHLTALENTIPFDIRKQEHFFVKGSLPQIIVDRYEKLYDSDLQVTFWADNEMKSPQCQYYAPLTGNQFEVYLPTGEYSVELLSRDSYPSPDSERWLHLKVGSRGETYTQNPMIQKKLLFQLAWKIVAEVLPVPVKQLIKKVTMQR